MWVRLPLPAPKDYMIKRLTFQERALVRSELAGRLRGAVEVIDQNPGLMLGIIYARKVMQEVATSLLQMK